MASEHIEHVGEKNESSDREKLDYWKEKADIFAETQSALRLEKTDELDQKRVEWWKKEAEKR